ncbi:MAG: TfoX/Sxy family DNA transformation protein [Gaiellaceae bacterium]
MTDLESLPNIGPVVASRLRQAGISTAEELLSLGAEQAFLRLRSVLPDDACLSTLYGLAGAVDGISDHVLPDDRRRALREFFRSR